MLGTTLLDFALRSTAPLALMLGTTQAHSRDRHHREIEGPPRGQVLTPRARELIRLGLDLVLGGPTRLRAQDPHLRPVVREAPAMPQDLKGQLQTPGPVLLAQVLRRMLRVLVGKGLTVIVRQGMLMLELEMPNEPGEKQLGNKRKGRGRQLRTNGRDEPMKQRCSKKLWRGSAGCSERSSYQAQREVRQGSGGYDYTVPRQKSRGTSSSGNAERAEQAKRAVAETARLKELEQAAQDAEIERITLEARVKEAAAAEAVAVEAAAAEAAAAEAWQAWT